MSFRWADTLPQRPPLLPKHEHDGDLSERFSSAILSTTYTLIHFYQHFNVTLCWQILGHVYRSRKTYILACTSTGISAVDLKKKINQQRLIPIEDRFTQSAKLLHNYLHI